MRVLITAGLFYPSKLGGPSKTLYWLAKGLVSRDVQVSVVTSSNFIDKDLIEFNKWITVDNINVRYCTTRSKMHYSVIQHSIKELKKCNVVLLSSLFYMPSFFIALFAVLTSKKIICSPRGELFSSAINASKLKLSYIKLLKFLFSKKIVFHATSKEEQGVIKKHLGSSVKTFIIPNYMELQERQRRTVSNDKYFLYVGRIAPIKALDKLLLGLAKSDTFLESEYKLLIAGDVEKQFEDYYSQLTKILSNNHLLKEKVVFLGNIDGVQKFQLYANAYYSILVSHSENFGNVIIEALSQGTPVIASKGTPWDILVEKEAGCWIDNSEESISECVTKVLNMEIEMYNKTRNNAYALAKKFDVFENIDNWLRVLTY